MKNEERSVKTIIQQMVMDVRNQRCVNQMTQRELAKKIGKQQPVIARIETLRTTPTMENLIKMIQGVGLKIAVVENKEGGTVLVEQENEESHQTTIAKIVKGIQQYRVQLGWTQRAFEKKTGIPQPSIARIEAASTTPTLESAVKMMSGLGLAFVLREP